MPAFYAVPLAYTSAEALGDMDTRLAFFNTF